MGVREAGQARRCVRVGALHLQRPHVHAPCCVGRIGTGFPVRGARGRTRRARQARAGARGLVPAVRRLLLVLSKPTSSAAGASGARQRAPTLTLTLTLTRRFARSLLGYHPLGRIAEAETKGIGFHATVADDALIRGLLIAPPPFPLSESTTRTEKTFCNARTPENHDGRKMDSVTVTGSLTNSDRGAHTPGLPPVVLHGRRKPWVRGRQRGDDVRGSSQLPVLSSPSRSGSSSRPALRG